MQYFVQEAMKQAETFMDEINEATWTIDTLPRLIYIAKEALKMTELAAEVRATLERKPSALH